jgi:hypothetical protein
VVEKTSENLSPQGQRGRKAEEAVEYGVMHTVIVPTFTHAANLREVIWF